MADWWEAAPLVEQKQKNWWDDAPVAGRSERPSVQQAADAYEKVRGTSTLNDATDAGIGGIPFSDEVYSALTALPNAAISAVKGDGFHPVDEYNHSQALLAELKNRREKRSPVASVAGEIAAGMGVGGVMAKNGLTLLNNAKPTLLSLMGRGAAEGALYGAAYGAGEGEGVDERLWNSAKGAGLGGTVGGVTGAIGRIGAGNVADEQQKIMRALTDDGLDEASALARMQELGPDAVLADLGPNLQGQTAALANMPGPANKAVRDALFQRNRGANDRIRGVIDETMGPNVVPSAIEEGITARQGVVGEMYPDVFRDARAVDTTDIANFLRDMEIDRRGPAQRAAGEVRRMLMVNGTADVLDPNPSTLFQTRQAIDGLLTTNADPKVASVLSEARQQVDDLLSRSVPGLKEVDAQFAELARQRDALSRGQQVLDMGRTAPRPEELAQEVAAAALPQGRMVGPSAAPLRLSQGARAEVERILGGNANDVSRLNQLIKAEGDWNRSRLSTLFGDDKANRLFRVLDNEMTFANTRNLAVGNSATAGRQQAMRELGGGGDPAFGVRDAYAAGGVLGALRGAGVKGAESIVKALTNSKNQSRNERLARLLIGRNVDVLKAIPEMAGGRKAIIDALMRTGAQQLPGYIGQ